MSENNDKRESGVNNNTDFYKDAHGFLKTLLPDDFDDKLESFIKDKNYNQNEVRLFKSMVKDALDFELTMKLMKHFISK